MSAAAEHFESLKIASIISEMREEKNLPGNTATYTGAYISFARLPCWINCASKTLLLEPHFKKGLSCREQNLPSTHIKIRKSEEAPDPPPHRRVSFLSWHSRETWFKMLHCKEIGDETATKVERCLASGQLYVFQNKIKKVKPKSREWLSFL